MRVGTLVRRDSSTRTRLRYLPVVIGALLVLAAIPDQGNTQPARRGPSAPHADLDDLFAEVGARIPAFAGVFVDEENGTLNIRMAGRGRADEAQRALVEVLGDPSLAELEPVALPAEYPFGRLKAWYERAAAEVVGLEEVTLGDIDERANRLFFGVTDIEDKPLVEAKLAELGVPLEAVIIEEVEPEYPQTSLRDAHRPIVGGLQISFKRGLDEPVCSLGFNATRSGVRVMVTASHCSATRGVAEGTTYYQPLSPASIGSEWLDPGHFTGGSCPAGRRCRYSDANISSVGDLTSYTVGGIARTALNDWLWNGLDMYRVTSEEALVVGRWVNRVGFRTGRSNGQISHTCQTQDVAGSDITLLCQGRAGYTSDNGDSGGPVFRITNSPSTNDVALVGIHWGGNGAFSPMSGIQNELGSLQTCGSGYTC